LWCKWSKLCDCWRTSANFDIFQIREEDSLLHQNFSEESLCAFQYRVEFSLSDGLPPMSSILIELEDNKGIRTVERTREGNWNGGVTYAFVIASASRLGVIEKVRMSSDMTVILAATPSRLGEGVRVSHLTVTPMNEWSDSLKAKKSVRFCHFIETARREDTSRCG